MIYESGYRVSTAPSVPGGQVTTPRTDEGGDAACWLPRVCPECGLLADQDPPVMCTHCGAQIPDDKPA